MVNILFIIFFCSLAAYFIYSPRKEAPSVIVAHALLQYILTLGLWIFQLNDSLAVLMLSFITGTTLLLIWARSLNYSRELNAIKLLFSLFQWVVLLGVGIFIAIKSPYDRLIPAGSWQQYINVNSLGIHPVIKLACNILLFSTFFHLIAHWGQKWTVKKSLFDLSPIWICFLLLAIIKYFKIVIPDRLII